MRTLLGPDANRYGHLAERAVTFLESSGAAQTSEQLTAQVLGAPFARQTAIVASLEELLARDERFCRDSAGTWRLTAWDQADQPLAEQEFAVVDVETTGGRSG